MANEAADGGHDGTGAGVEGEGAAGEGIKNEGNADTAEPVGKPVTSYIKADIAK